MTPLRIIWAAGAAPQIVPAEELPVARMMRGRPPAEVAELLPRLFSLCGAAQGQAARLAMGLPDDGPAPVREILRDHLAKLFIAWPRLLGLGSSPLPAGWQAGGATLEAAIWGGRQPGNLLRWLAWDEGVAPILAAIAQDFSAGEAVADVPPLSDPFAIAAEDNSPAARNADHPLMEQAEERFGRGPFWRALGRVVDLQAALDGDLLAERLGEGRAIAPAARGIYALTVQIGNGSVEDLSRVTPTDHLLAPGGVLERSLAALPAEKTRLAPLLLDILDPCVPYELLSPAEAEARDA